ncbi:chemotaxis protein CheW [Halothermothrix orenii]|uniref:Putative CheW protein n=1 Tax=Halothermothrix orenii (strain H 168 / OCM 544 / DSM 9562) TaxID=373903 RepID=B8CW49_HALOH|nr:chemotaxis protein CheW [Halothermothrix orenii]ACL69518.1 putative CheW protein [Halothermothrix orenii H 168]
MQVSTEEKDVNLEARKQFVIFQLGEEEYGVSITNSKEIIKPTKITNVPNTPDYVLGVINLRGQIVPVVDLRKRFNIKGADTDKQRIITVEVKGNLIGLMVDGVNEVVWFEESKIESAPEVDTDIKQEYIAGIGKIDERLIVLIDLEKLLFEDKEIEASI